MMSRRLILGMLFILNGLLWVATSVFVNAQGGAAMVGTVTVLHIDGQDGSYMPEYVLNTESGQVRLDLSPTQLASLGGKTALQGAQVAVTLNGAQRDGASGVESITVLGTRNYNTQPLGDISYYILPCRYADNPSTPSTSAQILDLYSGPFPSISDYFEMTSHGAVTDMAFSVRNWKTLPEPRSYYMSADYPFTALFDGCVALHDEDITFTETDGVVLVFNGEIHPFGIFAVGGGTYATLDDITQVWRSVWMPPWTYDSSTGAMQVSAHEIGHSLGWPHSNLSDNDGNPYDNPWDIMSNSYNASVVVSGVGIPKPSNLYHYLESEWVTPENVFTPAPSTTTTIKLQSWRTSGETSDDKYHIIDIPLYNGRRLTVEASQVGSAYYASGTANGVLIYNVDPSRSEDAWLVGAKDDAAAYSGGVWSPGETYTNKQFGIVIAVTSKMNDGYMISVTRGSEINPITVNTPADDTEVNYTIDFPFEWQAVEGATKYVLQVAGLPFNTPAYAYKKVLQAATICDSGTGVCSFVANTDPKWLPYGNRYYTWTVTAKNAANQMVGAGEAQQFYYFPFSTYINMSEPEDFAAVGPVATFSWLRYDDETFALHSLITDYRLRIIRPDGTKAMNVWRPVSDYTCTQDFVDSKVCRYTVDLAALKGGIKPGTYKWKVFGRNIEVGGTASSDLRRFSVDTSGRVTSPTDIFRAP